MILRNTHGRCDANDVLTDNGYVPITIQTKFPCRDYYVKDSVIVRLGFPVWNGSNVNVLETKMENEL